MDCTSAGDSRHLQIWVAVVGHSTSHHHFELLEEHAAWKNMLLEEHAAVLRSQVVLLHSSPFQAEALCASCCLGISIDCFLNCLIHGYPAKGILATKLNTEATLHELLVYLWVINGKT